MVLQFGLNDVAEIQGSGVRVDHDVSVENARSVAEDLELPFLDILPPLLADPEYMAGLTRSDRMHCDERGSDIMAGLVDDWPAWNDWFS